jgi:hypothetical protein
MSERRLWLARGEMPPLRDAGQPAARCHPPATRYADLETGGRAEVPLVRTSRYSPPVHMI